VHGFSYTLPTGVPVTLQGKTGTGTILDGTGAPGRVLTGEDPKTSVLRRLTFRNSTSTEDGGAVLLFGDVSVRISFVKFFANVAQGQGGGLRIDATMTGVPPIEITDSVFGAVGPSRNESAMAGGGLTVRSASSIEFLRNRVVGNLAPFAGGAALATTGSETGPSAPLVMIRDSVFRANEAPTVPIGGGGGGLVFAGARSVLSGNLFVDNLAADHGGGAYGGMVVAGSTMRLVRNTFRGNELRCDGSLADCGNAEGAGLFVQVVGDDSFGKLTQEANLFEANVMTVTAGVLEYDGGGEMIDHVATAVLTGDRFVGNDVPGEETATCSAPDPRAGGGLSINAVGLTGRNLAVAGNRIGDCGLGGGIYVSDESTLHLLDSTVSGNAIGSLGMGPGIYATGTPGQEATIVNSIIVGSAGPGTDLVGFATPDIRFSDVCLGDAFDGGPPAGQGNLCTDPVLQQPSFPEGNIHLFQGTPVIDKGSNALVPGALVKDYEGELRIQEGGDGGLARVDMGADELDIDPPDTVITAGPSGTIHVRTATFRFRADEPGMSFQCSIDGHEYAACTSPRTFTGLHDGNHAFRVFATDRSGNDDRTPALRTFRVDVG